MKNKVVKYVQSLQPNVFGQEVKNVKVAKVLQGDFNSNYFLKVNKNKYVLKLHVNNPLQLDSMLNVEFNILKYLNGVFGPKVCHVDTSKKDFPFDVLIYEYADGEMAEQYDKNVLINIAKVMSVIHSIDTNQMKQFLPSRTPFENFELFTNFPKDIKKTKEFAVIQNFIEKARHELFNNKSLFTSVNHCFIHYGLHLENILLQKDNKIKLLDWNLSCKGDKAEDLALVFSFAAICFKKPMDQKMRAMFLEQFTMYGDDRTLMKRLKLLEYMTSIYILCLLYKQLNSANISKEILKKNKNKYEACLKHGIVYVKKNFKF